MGRVRVDDAQGCLLCIDRLVEMLFHLRGRLNG